ncbi:MAG: phytoene/squalene synthase family protein [Candidatus Cyclobacteriaceae bacterium M3_2C_046]
MNSIYDQTTFECSKIITTTYSTSFTLGIKTLHQKFHKSIFGIYGFVRYADEIVDTFHDKNKKLLLERFKKETYEAIETEISLNPVLHSFQKVVNQFHIEKELIEAFFESMEMDLSMKIYNDENYRKYIYGSAEVVGLMCLRVFCEGDDRQYQQLKAPAKRLGAAFQKVNFLRDIKDDFSLRGRIYFPELNISNFNEEIKGRIINDIQEDFDQAYQGIIRLPKGARMGVYLAYIYYLNLFNKIKKSPSTKILNERIRIPDFFKYFLLLGTYIKYRFNFL